MEAMNLDKLDSNLHLDYLTNNNSVKSPLNQEASVYIDPFDVFNSKFHKSSSCASSSNVDTTSTKLEEDSNKSVYSVEQQAIKVKTIENEPAELEQNNQNLTLSEIISKKKRQSTIKENKKRCPPLTPEGTKKKKSESKSESKNSVSSGKGSKSSIKLENETHSQEIMTPKIVLVNGVPELYVPPSPKFNDSMAVPKTKLTTSNSFKSYNHTDKWTEPETKKFYRALELFGTDFSLIAQLFPNRNRMQIKNKFLKEEKTCPKKIDDIFYKKDKTASKVLAKVQKLHQIQQTQIKVEADNNNNFGFLQQQPNKTLPILDHNPLSNLTVVACTKPRSDSFASMTSLDMEIVNDLSDLFKVETKTNTFTNNQP
jgi:hypothetical protein